VLGGSGLVLGFLLGCRCLGLRLLRAHEDALVVDLQLLGGHLVGVRGVLRDELVEVVAAPVLVLGARREE